MKCNNSVKLRLSLLILTLVLSLSFMASCTTGGEQDPTRTGSYTINTPGASNPTSNAQKELTYTDITLLSAGDIMYHMSQLKSAYRSASDTYDFSENFQYVKNIISSADYAVVNFETTLANQNEYTSFPSFNSPLAVLDSIKDAGFDMLLYANNHCYDYKKQGFLATLGQFQKYGFEYIGGKWKLPPNHIWSKM